MRMMVVFEKGETLRYIGHLDLMRAMQRALRRSELPVSYSKGFNPHILLTFASALSTGAWGKREIMDVTLERDISPETFMEAMNAALPEDLRVLSANRPPAMPLPRLRVAGLRCKDRLLGGKPVSGPSRACVNHRFTGGFLIAGQAEGISGNEEMKAGSGSSNQPSAISTSV